MEHRYNSPFLPSTEGPIHRNAPLAPSQELAYRKKCIQLKRRLTEIETNNESTRKRISQEKEHVQKMRLLRVILLDQLKNVMELPAKKFTPEQLEKIGVMANGTGYEAEMAGGELPTTSLNQRPAGEGLLDDSSEESDENEPEPQERPERRRRANNNYRESVMAPATTTAPVAAAPANPSPYQQPSLPSLAPASSFSPAAPRDPAMLTSSFQVSSETPQAAGTPGTQSFSSQQPPFPADGPYAQQSSPVAANQTVGLSYQTPSQSQAAASSMSLDGTSVNGVSRTPTALRPQPQRPPPPFEQFTDHMRPQLEADNYPPEQIPARIQTEWENLSVENRNLWDVRYREQMTEYTAAMDEWKRAQRREGSGIFSRR